MKALLIATTLVIAAAGVSYAGSVTGGFGKAKEVTYCVNGEAVTGLWRDHRNDTAPDEEGNCPE